MGRQGAQDYQVRIHPRLADLHGFQHMGVGDQLDAAALCQQPRHLHRAQAVGIPLDHRYDPVFRPDVAPHPLHIAGNGPQVHFQIGIIVLQFFGSRASHVRQLLSRY